MKCLLSLLLAIFLFSSSSALYQTPVPANYFGKAAKIESRQKDSGELLVTEKINVLKIQQKKHPKTFQK